MYIIPGDADIFRNEAHAPITRSLTLYVYLTSNTTASCYARTHAEMVRQERERESEIERERESSLREYASPTGRCILEVAVEIGNSICAAGEFSRWK